MSKLELDFERTTIWVIFCPFFAIYPTASVYIFQNRATIL